MIVSISTSSPQVSIAILGHDGVVVASESLEAAGNASGRVAEGLQACMATVALSVADLTAVVVDAGPGSFTGVKAGVTFGKALAFALGLTVGLVSSFDLISRSAIVAFPSKKGEWFVRLPGTPVKTVTSLDGVEAIGYGLGDLNTKFPDAAVAGGMLAEIRWVAPEFAVPSYHAEPSISKPNKPFSAGVHD